MMTPLTNAGSRALHWTQTRLFDSTYDLLENSNIFARLTFRSVFGSFARLETAGGVWTFKRTGFWRTRATVRREGADSDLAVFDHNTWKGGGTLAVAGGRSFRVTTNFWQSQIEFQAEDGTALFRYQTEGFMRLGAALQVFPQGAELPELPWMLGFGWYIVVMTQHDQASQAVVIG